MCISPEELEEAIKGAIASMLQQAYPSSMNGDLKDIVGKLDELVLHSEHYRNSNDLALKGLALRHEVAERRMANIERQLVLAAEKQHEQWKLYLEEVQRLVTLTMPHHD